MLIEAMEKNKEGKGEREFLVGREAANALGGGRSSLLRRHMNKKCEGREGLMPISGKVSRLDAEMANANVLREECT